MQLLFPLGVQEQSPNHRSWLSRASMMYCMFKHVGSVGVNTSNTVKYYGGRAWLWCACNKKFTTLADLLCVPRKNYTKIK